MLSWQSGCFLGRLILNSNGYTTKAETRLVARGFGQKSGVDYFNTFAPTLTMSPIKGALTIAVQKYWQLYHFYVK